MRENNRTNKTMSNSSPNTTDKLVWLPHDTFGFLSVRLVHTNSPPTTTSSSKHKYSAIPVQFSTKKHRFVPQKYMQPIDIELSQDDIEKLDPVKTDTITMHCTNLSDLPSSDTGLALYHLQQRFESGQVHTLAGNTIISINPAARARVPGSGHTSNKLWDTFQHYNNTPSDRITPHMYSFAGHIYHRICNPEGQSHYVTVRGTNGSGKSECVDRMIEYYINVSRTSTNSELGAHLCAACSVLDAFTHVQSMHNVSSSRCCQTITMSFDQGNKGALDEWKINVPLLDAGGITGTWNSKERNFHIFYYLLMGMTDDELKKEMGIKQRDFQEFSCLACTDDLQCENVRKAKEMDLQEYLDFLDAVTVLNVGTEVVEMLRIVAAVMHLSVLEFSANPDATRNSSSNKEKVNSDPGPGQNKDKDKGNNTHKKIKHNSGNVIIAPPKPSSTNRSTVDTIAKLLGLDKNELESYLCCCNKEHPEYKTWSVGRAELHRNLFMNELYQQGVSALVTVLNERGKRKGSNMIDGEKHSITIFDPCVAVLKGKNDLQLQEFQTYYMNEKLRQLGVKALSEELESYHLEGVTTVSPFWPEENKTNAQQLETVVNILDGTKRKDAKDLDEALLQSLKKAATNVQHTERYDWKHILIEAWSTHVSKANTLKLFNKTTNVLLQDSENNNQNNGNMEHGENNSGTTQRSRSRSTLPQSFWLKSRGNIHASFEFLQQQRTKHELRGICCIQANETSRSIIFAPHHVLNQLKQLDIRSSATMGRVGFHYDMSCDQFYSWLHRLVPSLASESTRALTLNHDSMTKMFKTVAGCKAIRGILYARKGWQNLKLNANDIKIGNTKVFIKQEKVYAYLKDIRNTLWIQSTVTIQSFLRMCTVRCKLLNQKSIWLKKKEECHRQAEYVEMCMEDSKSVQMRERTKYDAHLSKMALQAEKIKQQKTRLKIEQLEIEVQKIVDGVKQKKQTKEKLIEDKITKKKNIRKAAVRIQKCGRRLLCQSKVECAVACLKLSDARTESELRRAVHYGSRTLLRWRIGTSRLMRYLQLSRRKLNQIKVAKETLIEEKETLSAYLNESEQWV